MLVKSDSGKPGYHLVPGDALAEIVKVLDSGALKYSDHNWLQGTEWHRYFSALMRHAWAWWGGEDNDPETGLSHLAHCGCCILFLLSYSKRNIGTDNRPHKGI